MRPVARGWPLAVFEEDALVAMPLTNRARAERLFSLTLERFFTQPEKVDADLVHLENLVYGLQGALATREAAVKDGL